MVLAVGQEVRGTAEKRGSGDVVREVEQFGQMDLKEFLRERQVPLGKIYLGPRKRAKIEIDKIQRDL